MAGERDFIYIRVRVRTRTGKVDPLAEGAAGAGAGVALIHAVCEDALGDAEVGDAMEQEHLINVTTQHLPTQRLHNVRILHREKRGMISDSGLHQIAVGRTLCSGQRKASW